MTGPIKPLSTHLETQMEMDPNGNGKLEPETKTKRKRIVNKPEPKEPDDLGN